MDGCRLFGDGRLAEEEARALGGAGLAVMRDGGTPDALPAIIACDAYDQAAQVAEGLGKGTPVLLLSQLTVPQSDDWRALCARRGIPVLVGAVVGRSRALGTAEAIVCYAGDRGVYQTFSRAVEALGGAMWAGEDPFMAALASLTANGVHHSTVLSLYAGVGMCRKYGLPLDTFFLHTLRAMPPLSQAAYRNVWAGLADPRDFAEVDDVIHGMEMLVAILKRTGGAGEIRFDEKRQRRLNAMLSRHWDAVMAGYGREGGERDV